MMERLIGADKHDKQNGQRPASFEQAGLLHAGFSLADEIQKIAGVEVAPGCSDHFEVVEEGCPAAVGCRRGLRRRRDLCSGLFALPKADTAEHIGVGRHHLRPRRHNTDRPVELPCGRDIAQRLVACLIAKARRNGDFSRRCVRRHSELDADVEILFEDGEGLWLTGLLEVC